MTSTSSIRRYVPYCKKSQLETLEQLLEAAEFDTDVCVTGGANGADSVWEACANKHGHSVVIMSFNGHNIRSSTKSRVIKLTPEELKLAVKWLKCANTCLKRATYDMDLLKRNYYQIKYSNLLYAVSNMEEVKSELKSVGIEGGTAWACQMFLLNYLTLIKATNDDVMAIPMYLYEMKTRRWYRGYASFTKGIFHQFHWNVIDSPPMPFGIYTGIGSRNITPDGRKAIELLFNKGL